MDSFTLHAPTIIHFGPGKRDLLGEILHPYKHILLVLSKGPFRENGAYADIKQAVERAGCQLYEIDDIDSNPKIYSARQGVEVCNAHRIDCVVAMGGGSAMDCGKIIAVAAYMQVDPYDLVWGKRLEVTGSLPVITIPTLAATGTEVNNAAVMVNEETGEKYWALTAFPTHTIMDPELTLTVPLRLTLWGAMDILSHTFEYYFNGNNSAEFQLCLAEALIATVMTTVDRLVKNPQDVVARGELMWCSVMAWGGLTKIGQGDPDMACHSIEESFSGYFDTHHGACLGILTPNWMQMAYKKAPKEFARFGKKVFHIDQGSDQEIAKLAVEWYVDWLITIGAPRSYADIVYGERVITKEELDHVAQTAYTIYEGHIGKLFELSLDECKYMLYQGLQPYGRENV